LPGSEFYEGHSENKKTWTIFILPRRSTFELFQSLMVKPICPPVLEAYRYSIMDVMILSISRLYGAMFIQSSNRKRFWYTSASKENLINRYRHIAH